MTTSQNRVADAAGIEEPIHASEPQSFPIVGPFTGQPLIVILPSNAPARAIATAIEEVAAIEQLRDHSLLAYRDLERICLALQSENEAIKANLDARTAVRKWRASKDLQIVAFPTVKTTCDAEEAA